MVKRNSWIDVTPPRCRIPGFHGVSSDRQHSARSEVSSAGATKLQSLQALRFLAAMAVVYHHGVEQAVTLCGKGGVLAPFDLGAIGAAGVDVFFVISGFVITMTGPLASPRPTGKEFFWRRWSRVVPLFYVVSLATLALTGFHLNIPQTVGTLFFGPRSGPTSSRHTWAWAGRCALR